jgi:hypothetical protein
MFYSEVERLLGWKIAAFGATIIFIVYKNPSEIVALEAANSEGFLNYK